jgi:iron only hydrogenase large subunit-like protein
MLGAVAKTIFAKIIGVDPKRIRVVSLMPCTAKKEEAVRPELVGHRQGLTVDGVCPQALVWRHHSVSLLLQKRDGHTQDVDYVLTTRELGRLLQSHRPRFAFPSLPETPFDPIMGESSGERE